MAYDIRILDLKKVSISGVNPEIAGVPKKSPGFSFRTPGGNLFSIPGFRA
jgi:hypothetical protein